MREHTPGPWEAVPPPVFDSGNPWTIKSDGQTIAIVVYGVLGDLRPASANAHLMAAAPNLLAALRYAEECISYETDYERCECEPCGECGKAPEECTGTECAQSCQCNECRYCHFRMARDMALAAIASVEDREAAVANYHPVTRPANENIATGRRWADLQSETEAEDGDQVV